MNTYELTSDRTLRAAIQGNLDEARKRLEGTAEELEYHRRNVAGLEESQAKYEQQIAVFEGALAGTNPPDLVSFCGMTTLEWLAMLADYEKLKAAQTA